jgi:hypothetical protein
LRILGHGQVIKTDRAQEDGDDCDDVGEDRPLDEKFGHAPDSYVLNMEKTSGELMLSVLKGCDGKSFFNCHSERKASCRY